MERKAGPFGALQHFFPFAVLPAEMTFEARMAGANQGGAGKLDSLSFCPYIYLIFP
jgi:hypothetical protein